MTHEVFISHSVKDQEVARTIVDGLEAAGIGCWLASRDIRPSENHAGAIVSAIENAGLFLLVFSESSNHSDHVTREVERAAHFRRTVLPVRIDDEIPNRELEYFLSMPQWFDARSADIRDHIPELTRFVRDAASTTAQQLGQGKGRASDIVAEVSAPDSVRLQKREDSCPVASNVVSPPILPPMEHAPPTLSRPASSRPDPAFAEKRWWGLLGRCLLLPPMIAYLFGSFASNRGLGVAMDALKSPSGFYWQQITDPQGQTRAQVWIWLILSCGCWLLFAIWITVDLRKMGQRVSPTLVALTWTPCLGTALWWVFALIHFQLSQKYREPDRSVLDRTLRSWPIPLVICFLAVMICGALSGAPNMDASSDRIAQLIQESEITPLTRDRTGMTALEVGIHDPRIVRAALADNSLATFSADIAKYRSRDAAESLLRQALLTLAGGPEEAAAKSLLANRVRVDVLQESGYTSVSGAMSDFCKYMSGWESGSYADGIYKGHDGTDGTEMRLADLDATGVKVVTKPPGSQERYELVVPARDNETITSIEHGVAKQYSSMSWSDDRRAAMDKAARAIRAAIKLFSIS